MACFNDMMDVAYTQVVEEASNPLIVHASLDTYKLSVTVDGAIHAAAGSELKEACKCAPAAIYIYTS